MHRLSEFIVGLVFGLGLLLSGMTDPGKVLGFLDLFGQWDPSLAFVMGGAILVGFFAFALAKTRTSNFLGGALSLPKSNAIDKRLSFLLSNRLSRPSRNWWLNCILDCDDSRSKSTSVQPQPSDNCNCGFILLALRRRRLDRALLRDLLN